MELHRFGFRLVFGLALSLAGVSVVSAGVFAGGDGTPSSPYQIASAQQWVAFSADPNLWDKHFVLIRDLDMVGVEPNAVQPIGNFEGQPFAGVIDGQGHTISHLRIVRPKDKFVGVFGEVGRDRGEPAEARQGHVHDLHLRGIYIHGTDSVGGLVGDFEKGSIRNCSVTGTVIGVSTVGGLVGWASDSVASCTATVEVRGKVAVGGLVGCANGSILHCCSSGRIYGETVVGGLIGAWDGPLIPGTWESFSIQHGDLAYKIAQCRSDCAVYGATEVGGLVGSCMKVGQIEDCYASGPVIGSTSVGGLVGRQVDCGIVRCLAARPVTGNEDIGALVGKTEIFGDPNSLQGYPLCEPILEKRAVPDPEDGTEWRLIYRPGILACFCAAETLGTNRLVGSGNDEADVTVLTAEQQGQAAPFRDRGWDFGTVWQMPAGKPYPRLTWESTP